MKLNFVLLQKHAEETPVGAIELSKEQLAAVVGGGHEERHHRERRERHERHERRERHERHEHHEHHRN